MKVSKLLSIDSEVAQQLSKEKNASKLVNDLLVDYYEGLESNIEKKNSSTEAGTTRNQEESEGVQAENASKSAERGTNSEFPRESTTENAGEGL